MKKKWNDDEINFLKENYSIMGSKFCAESLNKSVSSVTSKANILKLKSEVKYQKIIETKIKKNINKYDVSNFIDIKNEEVAYILGLLWADGTISNFGYKLVSLNCVVEDMDYFKNIFLKTSKDWVLSKEWFKYFNGGRSKNQQTIKMSSIMLYDFLFQNDYDEKSFVSANKILNKIPKKLHKFFILGLFDGDGHFNVIKKTKQAEWVISSTYEQDWDYLESFCKENNIEYSIYRLIVPLGKVSKFVVRKLGSIEKLIKIVHNNDLGLPRKKEKINFFLSIRSLNSKINKWSNDEIDFLIKNHKNKNIFYNIERTKNAILWKISELKKQGLIKS